MASLKKNKKRASAPEVKKGANCLAHEGQEGITLKRAPGVPPPPPPPPTDTSTYHAATSRIARGEVRVETVSQGVIPL